MAQRGLSELAPLGGESEVRQALVQNATGVVYLAVAHEMNPLGSHAFDCNRANYGQLARYAGGLWLLDQPLRPFPLSPMAMSLSRVG